MTLELSEAEAVVLHDLLYRISGKEEYFECLNRLQKYNGGKIRLPKKELELRIKRALKAV